MKLNIALLLFLILLFSFLNKIESYYLELVQEDDTFAYNNVCSPSFIFILPSSITVSSLTSDKLGTLGGKILYSDSDNTIYSITTSIVAGLYENIDIKITTPAELTVFSSDLQYNCITPPINLQYTVQNKLLVGDNLGIIYFTLKLNNIEKRISQFTIENTNSNPYIATHIPNVFDRTSQRFKLVYNYSTVSTSPTPQTLQFKVEYGLPGSSIQLEFDSPISVYSTGFCFPKMFLPNKNSFTFWDSSYSNYFQCSSNPVQHSSKLFLHSINNNGNDRFQTFKMVFGNGEDGAMYMLVSQYQESNYPSISKTFNSYIYNSDFTPGVDTLEVSYTSLYPSIFLPINSNNIIITDANLPIVGLTISEFSFQTLFPFKFNMNYRVASDLGEPVYSKLAYPYGITGGKTSSFTFSVSKTINPTFDRDIGLGYNAFIAGATELKYTQIPTTADSIPPRIIDIDIYYTGDGTGNYAVLTVHIKDDSSGFSYMKYGNNLITAADLTSGDKLNGYYEKTIIVTFSTECILLDRAGNSQSFDKVNDIYSAIGTNSSNMVLKRVPFISAIDSTTDKDVLNVTMFKFEHYDVNVQIGFLQRLYFGYQGSTLGIPVQFHLINPFYDESQIDPMKLVNQFYKDTELDVFIIDFPIPKAQCTGNLDYLMVINGKRYGMDYFASQFQGLANLSVISSSCDETPPQITTCEFIQSVNESGYVSFALLTEVKTVGWRIQIKDEGNGLQSAFFKVVSNLDPLGYDFYFTPLNATSGDKGMGFYDLIFDVSGEYPDQTFSIINIVLVDQGGHKSELIYDFDNQKHTVPISPLMEQPDNFISSYSINTLSLNDVVDTESPTLEHFEVVGLIGELDVGQGPYSEISFHFKTADTVSLSTRHIPTTYLDYYLNYGENDKLTRIECVTTEESKGIVGSVIVSANYTSNCKIPYGWSATQDHFSISLYGIVDSSLNINGYTSLDLKNLGYTPIINTIFSKKPIIISHSTISSIGGIFTIFGSNFGGSISQLQLNYVYDGTLYSISNFIHLSNSMIVSQIPTFPDNKTNSMLVSIINQATQVVTNGFIVPIIQVPIPIPVITVPPTVIPTSPPPVKVPCLNNCGGPLQGTCIKDVGCHCISPFTGIDCRSGSVIIPPPKPNATSPIVNNNIPNFQYSSISSIVAIREISFDGVVVNSHYFSQWDFTTISTNKYLYSTEIIKNQLNVSTINATLEWFEKEAVIEFAGSNIKINPSSLKYTISVDKYPFSSKLNTMEIVFKSQFSSLDSNYDVCSSKQVGLNDGVDYTLLSIGEFSFYSKFVKAAIIDNKTVSIENHNVDKEFNGVDKESFNNIFSYTAIKIPNYEISATVDPDFSVLINPESIGSDDNNSICNNSPKSLTAAQIAGIVVGGVAFLFVIIIFIVMLISPTKRLSIKIFCYRLKQKSFK